MQRLWRIAWVAALLVSLFGLSACKKKQTKVPQRALAPTIPWPQPEVAPPPQVATEPQRPEPQPSETQKAAAKPARKPHHVFRRNPPPPPPAQQQPPPPAEAQKTVVPNAGTTQPSTQLTASLSQQEAVRQKMVTTQLLDSTESNLKSITRSLSTDEQNVLQHIKSFVQQSRSALDSNDYERAYNLAVKAHSLSDDLIKH